MKTLRYLHRFVTLYISIVVLFLAVTGSLIQLVDLRSIVFKYPAKNPNVLAMREAFDGPGIYAVRQASDYDAAAIPDNFAYRDSLAKVVPAARQAAGEVPFSYVEFRMNGQQLVAQVGLGRGHITLDPTSGQVTGHVTTDPRDPEIPDSIRNDFKHLHRMTVFGNWALFINVFAAVGLAVLIVTGSIMYFKLLGSRRSIGSSSWVWWGGGTWRALHRVVSLVSVIFLVVAVSSGAWLAFESLVAGMAGPPKGMGGPPSQRPMSAQPGGKPGGGPGAPGDGRGRGGDGGRFDMLTANDLLLLTDDPKLTDMLRVTLTSFRNEYPVDPAKVVRIRRYSGYDQGIVITGGNNPQQLVYNAVTGKPMSESEPGYPPVIFPFGWEAHQIAKMIHRGDYFGLTGRWMDLIAGFSMIYLSLSGIVMYYQMWAKRRKANLKSIMWK